MLRLRHIAPLLLLAAGGCAQFARGPDAPAPVTDGMAQNTDAESLRAQARLLRYRGRHAESLAQLDRAIALRPDDAELREEREQTAKTWRLRRQELQDRLLVSDTRKAREQLPILRELVRAQPEDPQLRSELDGLRDSLALAQPSLSDCGMRQAEPKPDLARLCLRLALDIREDPQTRALLAKLAKPQPTAPAGRAAKAAPGKPAAAAGATPDTETVPELIKARELIRQGNPYGAIRHLSKLEERGEATPQSRALLQQAKDVLERDTLAMLQAGDELFREGKPREALALWQAVLNMDPYNEEARHKSELAMRELESDEEDTEPTPQAGPAAAGRSPSP